MSKDTTNSDVYDLHTKQLEKITNILQDFIPLVISDLKVLNERTCRMEEDLKITKRQTELIPKIHNLLEEDVLKFRVSQKDLKN